MRFGFWLLLIALTLSRAGAADHSLFDGKTLAGWQDPARRTPAGDSWTVQDGAIMSRPNPRLREDLLTTETFGDFDLTFEWRVGPAGNTGIKYLVQQRAFVDLSKASSSEIQDQLLYALGKDGSERANIAPEAKGKDYTIAFEFQLVDDALHPDARKDPRHACGSLYGLIASSRPAARPAGQWNTGRLIVKGDHVEHWINGVQVVNASLTDPKVAKGLADRWGFEHPAFRLLTQRPQRRTSIVLQHHGDQVWFRNLRVHLL